MVHAEVDRAVGRIKLRTTWNMKELVRGIPGARWDTENRHWTVPATWASLVTLRGVFGQDLTTDEATATWAWEVHGERIAPAIELRNDITGIPDDDNSPIGLMIKSWRQHA